MPATTPPTRMQLQSKVAQLERSLRGLRDLQEGLPKEVKKLQTKLDKLNKIAYDENAPEHKANGARVDRDFKVAPDLIRAKNRRDSIMEEVNLKEAEVLRAQWELRELETEIANTRSLAASNRDSSNSTQPRTDGRAATRPIARARAQPQRTIASGAHIGEIQSRRHVQTRDDAPTYSINSVQAREMMLRTERCEHAEASKNGGKLTQTQKDKREEDRLLALDTDTAPMKAERKKKPERETKPLKSRYKSTMGKKLTMGKKRKSDVLQDDDDDDDYAGTKRAKTVETEFDDRISREKSTNDDVTTSRGRSVLAGKGEKRARSSSSSPPPSPVKRVRRRPRVVHEDESEDEADAPKCATSTSAKKYTAPTAQMTSSSTAESTPKGTKRTASWSVGDAIASDPKRQKTGPSDGVDRTVREGSEDGEILDSDTTETSNGESATSSKDQSADSETSASSVSSETNKQGSTAGKKTSRLPFKGIMNIGASCFSSVVVQLIDAALEGRDLDHLLGELIETARFGISDKDCRKIEFKLEKNKSMEGKKSMVREAVMAAVLEKNLDKISVARHLRKVLEELREDNGDQPISAFRFQSVMAEGDQENAQESMNGDKQCDASEYLTKVVDALKKDPKTEDPEQLAGLFEMEVETKHRCPVPGCGYEQNLEPSIHNQHIVSVQQPADFSMLFESSKHSKTDKDCPKCGEGKLRSSIKFARKPDNFVVTMSRTEYDVETDLDTKNGSRIKLDQHELKIDDAKYALSAVVMHKGASSRSGHYFMFREQAGKWSKIDDSVVTKDVPEESVTDAKGGQCAMLLFKKQRS